MNINTIIAEYNRIKEERASLEKQEKALREQILLFASDKNMFETDQFTVIIKSSERVTLDTKALYKDFPEMKSVYGKTATVKTLAIAEKATEKTA
jgi:predicted phage-related endonuclease